MHKSVSVRIPICPCYEKLMKYTRKTISYKGHILKTSTWRCGCTPDREYTNKVMSDWLWSAILQYDDMEIAISCNEEEK